MDGKKLIAVSWWTFAYILAASAIVAFLVYADSRLANAFLLLAVLGYLALTWLLFFRRR